MVLFVWTTLCYITQSCVFNYRGTLLVLRQCRHSAADPQRTPIRCNPRVNTEALASSSSSRERGSLISVLLSCPLLDFTALCARSDMIYLLNFCSDAGKNSLQCGVRADGDPQINNNRLKCLSHSAYIPNHRAAAGPWARPPPQKKKKNWPLYYSRCCCECLCCWWATFAPLNPYPCACWCETADL